MTSTTLRPFPVKADRERATEALNAAFDVVDQFVFAIPDGDPTVEEREVTAEHVAEAATMLDVLETELLELQDTRDRLKTGLSYLVVARRETEHRARQANDA